MAVEKRRALKRALWTSFSRLLGVSMGAGAGSLIYKLVGGFHGWMIAAVMAFISMVLMTFAEYERERDS